MKSNTTKVAAPRCAEHNEQHCYCELLNADGTPKIYPPRAGTDMDDQHYFGIHPNG